MKRQIGFVCLVMTVAVLLSLSLRDVSPVGKSSAFSRNKHTGDTRPVRRFYQRRVKRAFDMAVAAVCLVLLAPLLVVIAVLVRLQLGSPVLFRQVRPGRYGQPFTLYKFRTMTDARDATGNLLPDDQRLTPFGQFLRSTSLDELPELLNILKGDMSLVGPRPLIMRYLDRYTPEQARRHEAVPGITGWAQINGRNAASWEKRFEMDVWYVDNCSLWTDLKIICLTPLTVLRREGIHEEGHVTMSEFMGTPAPEATQRAA